jgi:hypothetical protein
MQVGKLQYGDDCVWQQEALVLLQTLSTRDPDELAGGFRRWDLPGPPPRPAPDDG